MKQYVVDELRYNDYEKIKMCLDENLGSSEIAGIYWLPIDDRILAEKQTEHINCQPFFFVIILEENLISTELLVRTKNKIKCNCIGYATEKQRNWLIGYMDAMLNKLEISV
ncbi:MAG: hypothetical protein FP814_10850 [Desulfobacterium sp.]|nr:hypothetical protein [Desulfobacterium sp.]MBU3948422.1 hypothetical protein [Pseudomonadota bacterium]MBU4037937.1 hypothetical protein [Pseudomonadota bacterium]